MAFLSFLSEHPIGFVVPGPGVILDDYNGVIPDIVFISNERRKQVASGERVMGAPDLAVEVLSPGPENEHLDRKLKRRLYSRFGVKEYWLLDPASRTAEVYMLRKRGLELARTLKGKDLLKRPLLPGFSVKVSDLFKL